MRYLYAFLLILTLLWRVVAVTAPLSHLEFGNLLEKQVEGVAIVVDEPDRRENSLRLVVNVEELNGKKIKKTKMLVTVGPYTDISYGDRFEFTGKLEKPENFETESGTTFDYVHFLAKDGIFYELYFPKIKNVSHGYGNLLFNHLLAFKYSFVGHLAKVIPEPELSLLGGLLLGAKQSLGKELLNDFKTTGVIHMVVISGYNITIVAEGIMDMLSFLPRILRLSFSGAGVILFVIMTGASGASIRAGIMALVVILGKVLGRQYNPMRALLFAAACMVLHNPLILLYDPSFQLSFLATLGLLLVSPLLSPYLTFVTTRYGLREMVSATVSIQLFLLPFLLYLSGNLSLVALPVNLLVLFPVPFTMLIGFITGLISYVSPVMAMIPGFVTYALLHYILYVVETAANVPFAAVSVPGFPFWLFVLFYLFFIFILSKLHKRNAILKRNDPRQPSS